MDCSLPCGANQQNFHTFSVFIATAVGYAANLNTAPGGILARRPKKNLKGCANARTCTRRVHITNLATAANGRCYGRRY
jgi:hypothetical protein